MNITSGEVYYRTRVQNADIEIASKEFREFLQIDFDPSNLAKQNAYNLLKLQKAREANRKQHEASMQLLLSTAKVLQSRRDRTMLNVKSKTESMRQTVSSAYISRMQRLMDLVLQYGSILRSELKTNYDNVQFEKSNITASINQIKVSLELRLFAEYISLETNRHVRLRYLEKDSDSYKRCRKAIKDNIAVHFLKEGNFHGLRVLNVYHIDNKRLSTAFNVCSFSYKILRNDAQIAVEAAGAGGKVKGLFCAVPKEHLYNFLCYGLRQESEENIFEAAWFAHPIISEERPPNMSRLHNLGFGRSLLSSKSPKQIYFGRSSTPQDILQYSPHVLSYGVFIVLCRVLTVNTYPVEEGTPVTSQLLTTLKSKGYDSVYLKQRDEYIMINSKYVIPEFLMHLQIVSAAKEAAKNAVEDVSSATQSMRRKQELVVSVEKSVEEFRDELRSIVRSDSEKLQPL